MPVLDEYSHGDDVRVVRSDGTVETWQFDCVVLGNRVIVRPDISRVDEACKMPSEGLFLHWQMGGNLVNSNDMLCICDGGGGNTHRHQRKCTGGCPVPCPYHDEVP